MILTLPLWSIILIPITIGGWHGCNSNDDLDLFQSRMLNADGDCSSQRTTMDDIEDTIGEDVIDLGFQVIGAIVPYGGLFGASWDFINLISGSDDGLQDAFDELYEKLTRCMDAKINEYRARDTEERWSALAGSYADHMGRQNAGGSIETFHHDMDDLWKDMNVQIDDDFSHLDVDDYDEYLEAQALLPAFSIAARIYFLVTSENLGMIMSDINNGLGPKTIEDYNYDLSVANRKLETLQDWVYNAFHVIQIMYKPHWENKKIYQGTNLEPSAKKLEFNWQHGERSDSYTCQKCIHLFCKWDSGYDDPNGTKWLLDPFNNYMDDIYDTYLPFIDEVVRQMKGQSEMNCAKDQEYISEYDQIVNNKKARKFFSGIVLSQHSNKKEDRIFKWKYCGPMNMKTSNINFMSEEESSFTSYDSGWKKGCSRRNNGHAAVNGIYSEHNNDKEDRIWQITCGFLDRNLYRLRDCNWIEQKGDDFVNEYDEKIGSVYCPHNGVIRTIHSVHNNDKEDRIFNFECCTIYDV